MFQSLTGVILHPFEHLVKLNHFCHYPLRSSQTSPSSLHPTPYTLHPCFLKAAPRAAHHPLRRSETLPVVLFFYSSCSPAPLLPCSPAPLLPCFIKSPIPYWRRTTRYEWKKLLSNPLPFFPSSLLPFFPSSLLPAPCSLLPCFLTAGYSLQLRSSFENLIQSLVPPELGTGALRTLAAIALKEPVAQTDLINLRGSGAYQHIQELINLGFVRRRRQTEGRSYWLNVTDKFHQHFELDQLLTTPATTSQS